MFGEKKNFGSCLLCGRNNVIDLATAVMRQFRMDVQIGAHFAVGATPREIFALCCVFLDRLACLCEILGPDPIDGVLGSGCRTGQQANQRAERD